MAINNQIIQQRIELERKSSLGLNIRQTKLDIKEVEGSINQLDSFFIAPGKELDFISSVEALGTKTDIKLNLNPQFPGQDLDGKIKIIPLQISAQGSPNQIQKFMLDLEALPYYYNIDSISVSGSGSSTNIELNGNTYSLK